jgi:hypothetical protein
VGPDGYMCMYVLTIRDGLHTRPIAPDATIQQDADHLDLLLPHCGERGGKRSRGWLGLDQPLSG